MRHDIYCVDEYIHMCSNHLTIVTNNQDRITSFWAMLVTDKIILRGSGIEGVVLIDITKRHEYDSDSGKIDRINWSCPGTLLDGMAYIRSLIENDFGIYQVLE